MRNVMAVMIAVVGLGVVPVHAEELATLTPPAVPTVPAVMVVPAVAMHSLYASYVALSVLDFQTTRMALNSGNFHEANSLMSPVAGHSTALLAVKSAAVATTIYLTQRLRPHHPRMAIGAIVAANVISGVVVTHNVMTISGRPTGMPGQ